MYCSNFSLCGLFAVSPAHCSFKICIIIKVKGIEALLYKEFRHDYTLLFLMELFVVQSLSHVQLFATPWTAACQASLSITNSWSLFKLTPIELVMPFICHLVLYCPFLLLPSIFPGIGVFSNESALCIR